MKLVTFTAAGIGVPDPDGDSEVDFELTSAEQVLRHEYLGHLQIFDTDIRFECPLLR